ncbi:hypothetical protein ACP70R_045741 [Stipagrostis hirtigluma subsp. patula]
MDHILQLEHHSAQKKCTPRVARTSDNTLLVFFFAFATIASLALFLSFSMGDSLPSTLSVRFLAVGSFVMTKKAALFLFSNVIFLFLAADYRCFFTISTSTSDVPTCEPGAVLAKQSHHHQEVEQCAIQSCVSYSGNLNHKKGSIVSEDCTHPAKEDGDESWSRPRMSDNTTPMEKPEGQEDLPLLSESELFALDDEASSVILETVVVEEPTCGTAQELEKLEIDELNKKFEEFIQSKRIRWIKEEAAYLHWQKEGNAVAAGLAC